ncbi:PGF-CTERM sorting domain-containing protein [Halopenitus sp. H-Gu1]|uniref:DUF7345 domain-containing protein n=1 Tax=Halopenitus sp. H-Gu1 TaxID=3242697 RepID=UPI00359EBA67
MVTSLVAGAVGTAAATDHDEGSALVVDLEEDGDATITLISRYDLTDEDERRAVHDLANDTEARSALRDRFESRMASVADDTAEETGRQMSVSEGSIDVSAPADSDVGTVALSVHWSGLAAIDGESLVLTEPFASGFSPDRTFVVSAPDGYAATSVTPEADAVENGSLRWDAGTTLEGFEVTFEPTTETTDGSGTSESSAPGFGILAGILALVGVLLAARTRTSD